MKRFLLTLAALVLVQAVISQDDAYEDVDIEKFFSDDVKRQEFFDCMLGVVDPCSDKNELLKVAVGEVMSTNCEKCSDKQKESFKQALEIMQTKYEDQLKAMLARFKALKEKQ